VRERKRDTRGFAALPFFVAHFAFIKLVQSYHSQHVHTDFNL